VAFSINVITAFFVRKFNLYLTLFLLLGFLPYGLTFSVELKSKPISVQQYLDIVKQNNAHIGSASLDMQTAGANKEAQILYRFAPSVSYSRGTWQNQSPYTPYTTPASNTYALSFSVEGWGKRNAREKLAQAQIEASAAQFEGASNDIQTTALNAYIDALRLSFMVKLYQATLDKLQAYRGNPKVADAQNFLNSQKAKTEKDQLFASLSLLNFSGDALQDPPYPIGSLNFPPQSFNTQELIVQAQNNRAEVLSLLASIETADKNVDLTMKNRNVDVYPYIAQTRTPQYKYSNDATYSLPAVGPLPAQTITSSGTTYTAQNQMMAGITIPIPITNYLQSADIVSAANHKLQYEMKLRDLKVQIRVQVLQASLQYEAAKDNLLEAQQALDTVVKKSATDPIAAIMKVRDTEGALLDSKTNHLKALIHLWRQSGNYTVPTL
jgi:outer membrane protein TolC